MSTIWRELLDRLLDGGRLTDAETRVLTDALERDDGGGEAADWLRFSQMLSEACAPAESPEVLAARERLFAKLALREQQLKRRAAASRRRSVWRTATAAAAAAILLAVLGRWALLHKPYAAPQAEGDFTVLREGAKVSGESDLRRGDRVVAGREGTRLRLGGYCELTLEPKAEVVLRGEPQKEVIGLETGRMLSKVEHQKGAFTVQTPLGTLKALGTEFTTTVERTQSVAGAPAPPGGPSARPTPPAAVAPKLVNARRVFRQGDPLYKRPNQFHAFAMRLSPDEKHVLYSRPKPGQTVDLADPESRRKATYELVLRVLATGKETVLPIEPVEIGWRTGYTRFNYFDPVGARLLLTVSEQTTRKELLERGVTTGKDARYPYDIASAKLQPVQLEGNRILHRFGRTGNRLVGICPDLKSKTLVIRVFTAQPNGTDVCDLKVEGYPNSVCPTADVLCVWAPPKGAGVGTLGYLRKQKAGLEQQLAADPLGKATNVRQFIEQLERQIADTEVRAKTVEAGYQPQRLTLYDLAADKEIAELPVHEKNSQLDDTEPQWTPDGRYLYYYDVEPFMVDTVEGPKERLRECSRIWDRIAGKPVWFIRETRPIGPGPTRTTMVLAHRPIVAPQGEVRPGGFLLHDAPTGKQWPLGDDTMQLIHAWGRQVLYAKRNADGTEAVYLAEIDMGEAPERLTFGPVIERDVHDDGDRVDFLIDFDTAELCTHPPEVRGEAEIIKWMRQTGTDAVGETSASGRGLPCVDMVVIPTDAGKWDNLTPEELRKSLAGEEPLEISIMSVKPSLRGLPPEEMRKAFEDPAERQRIMAKAREDRREEFPSTFLFKTREGGMGILQILSIKDDVRPREIKVRYKMIEHTEEAPWGEAVEGVQVRLRADKIQWTVGETPSFKVDFRNNGKRNLQLVFVQPHWSIELDGVWYHPTVRRLAEGRRHAFGPGAKHDDIAFTPAAWGKWRSMDGKKPLEFPPGKHTIRMRFVALPSEKGALEPPPQPVRVISNPVEIEMVLPETPSLTAEQREHAEALIQQFEAREFTVRQQAVEELIQMGPAVLPLIRKTLAETKDAEVKLRCEMVIKAITEKPKRPWEFMEKHITDLGPPEVMGPIPAAYAANGEAIAFQMKRGDKAFVLHNGREQREYDRVAWLTLSEDGSHLAYAAKRNGKWFAVWDGIEGAAYDMVMLPVLSPDGKRLAYNARNGEDWFVVCDGKAWKQIEYHHAGNEKYFSKANRHLISTARRIGFPGHFPFRDFVVVDGIGEGRLHDWVWLAPPGDSVRYVVVDGPEVRLVELTWIPGQDVPKTLVERPVRSLGKLPPGGVGGWSRRMSPDWQSVAWTSQRGKQKQVVFGGQEMGPYDEVDDLSLTFSLDGKRLAFAAKRQGEWFAVVDRKEGPRFQSGMRIVFSPDGKHVAYTGRRGDEPQSKGFRVRGHSLVFLDGKQIEEDRTASSLTFSPDSRHLAYVAGGVRTHIACDGMTGTEHDRIHDVGFSPDGGHLFYVAEPERNGPQCMVCDGIAGPLHEEIRRPLIYNGKLRYWAVDGGRMKLVELESWPEDLDWTHGLRPKAEPDNEKPDARRQVPNRAAPEKKPDEAVRVTVSVASGVVAWDFGGETGQLAAGEARSFTAVQEEMTEDPTPGKR